MNYKNPLKDANADFSPSRWAIPTSHCLLFTCNAEKRVEYPSKSLHPSICGMGCESRIVPVLRFLVHVKSGHDTFSGCKYGWRCPLDLRQFDVFQLQPLGDFIFFELCRFESSSICCQVDWSHFGRWELDSILSGPSLSHMGAPQRFQLGKSLINSLMYCA